MSRSLHEIELPAKLYKVFKTGWKKGLSSGFYPTLPYKYLKKLISLIMIGMFWKLIRQFYFKFQFESIWLIKSAFKLTYRFIPIRYSDIFTIYFPMGYCILEYSIWYYQTISNSLCFTILVYQTACCYY